MWSISKGSQDGGIAIEDLDTLQFELEKTLVDTVQKKWNYEQEYNLILTTQGSQSADNSSSQDSGANITDNGLNGVSSNNSNSDSSLGTISKNVTNTSHSEFNSSTLTTPVVISSATIPICRPSEDQNGSIKPVPTKRNHHSKTNKKSSKKPRPDSTQAVPTADISHLLIRNDVPEKFWPFVSQYCVEPTKEQFEVLETMLGEYQDTSEYFKIPNLGPKKINGRSPKKGSDPRSPSESQGFSSDGGGSTAGKKKKSPNSKMSSNRAGAPQNDSCFGALTQRLVSCLIEEDLNSLSEAETEVGIAAVTAHNNAHPGPTNSPSIGTNSSSSRKKQTNGHHRIPSLKNLDLGSVKQLEKSIRRELERHQILSKSDEVLSIEDDDDDDDEDDEIVRELKSCQSELSVIQAFNEATLGQMLSQAKRRAELESVRRSLDAANLEVIESYHRLLQAKQKKRNPTKRERDTARKSVREQEAIFKRCDELASSLGID